MTLRRILKLEQKQRFAFDASNLLLLLNGRNVQLHTALRAGHSAVRWPRRRTCVGFWSRIKVCRRDVRPRSFVFNGIAGWPAFGGSVRFPDVAQRFGDFVGTLEPI